jgi:DNA-binding phage protein
MSEGIPYETLSAELLQAVRGRHAQTLLSRRLGYTSNIVYRWETEKCWPTVATFLQLCKRVGIDVAASFRKFYGRHPDWLEGDPCSPQTVVAFLKDLQGTVPLQALARASGQNRFTVSRWLSGTAQPRLPDFLRVVEATSRRTLDFVSTFTNPQNLPCVAKAWAKLQRAKQVAYESPWSHAVLHALELEELRRPKSGGLTSLVHRLGIPQAEIVAALHALEEAGQVRRYRNSWRIIKQQTVNTAQDPERALQLKAFWFQVATERVRAHAPGFFGYSLFAISEQDLRRLREVQLEYIRQMQAIIAESAPGERVGLYAVQLLDLAKGADNVFSPGRNAARRPSKSAAARRK